MTTPIVHDGRTDAEKQYDSFKDGSAYTKPATLMLAVADFIESAASQDDQLTSLLTDLYGDERVDKDASGAVWDQVIDVITSDPRNDGRADEDAIAAWIDEQAEPVTLCDGNNGQGADWTEYRAGDVTLTIQHHGFVPRGGTPYMLEILGHDIDGPWTLAMLQQLRTDLGNLLTDDRVLATFDGEPAAPDDMADILTEIDGGDRTLLDERFDTVIDQVFELEDAQRAQAVALWEGFVAGVSAATEITIAGDVDEVIADYHDTKRRAQERLAGYRQGMGLED